MLDAEAGSWLKAHANMSGCALFTLFQTPHLHLGELQEQRHEAGGPPVISILLQAPPSVGLAGRGQ